MDCQHKQISAPPPCHKDSKCQGVAAGIPRQALFALIGVLVLAGVVFLGTFCSNFNVNPAMWSYSKTAFAPMLISDGNAGIEETFPFQEGTEDYYNYWIVSGSTITKLYTSEGTDRAQAVAEAESVAEHMMDTFYRAGCFPRPPYQDYDYGWVSSMDAPTIAVMAQLLYEETGKEVYRQFVEDLSAYILKDVSEGGFTAEIDGEHWLFEYADVNTTAETGYFVLNGSLLGTLCTAMVAQVTENEDLQKQVDSQTRLYQKKSSEFYYQDGSWCYYMLNKPAVNQPHYVLYEIELFHALSEVTKNSFYQEEAERRAAILREAYPLYLEENDGVTTYYFIRGGAPHFYYTDIYGTELAFYDQSGTLIKTDQLGGTEYEHFIMQGEWPENADYVEWNVLKEGVPMHMGRLPIHNAEEAESLILPKISYSAAADGEWNEGKKTLSTDPMRDEHVWCDLIGKLESLPADSNQVFSFEINNPSEQSFGLFIVLYDESGQDVSRYLKAILPGKNLVTFNLRGFVDYGKKEFQNISQCILRVYTPDGTEPVELSVEDFICFQNSMQWARYMQTGGFSTTWEQ